MEGLASHRLSQRFTPALSRTIRVGIETGIISHLIKWQGKRKWGSAHQFLQIVNIQFSI